MKIAFLSLCDPNSSNDRRGQLHGVYHLLRRANDVDWIRTELADPEGYDCIVYADYSLVANLSTNIPLMYVENISRDSDLCVQIPEVLSSDGFYIPVYVINMKDRLDRREHIVKEFEGREEFDVNLFEACKHPIGAVGLWQSMIEIIRIAQANDDDVVVICEDDHFFTSHYSKEYLFKNIFEAHEQGAEILSGGIGGFGQAVPVSRNRYWLDWFWSTQFIVVYKRFYQKMLDYPFKDSDTADGVISALSANAMVMYPFISEQKDFGYSDVTQNNANYKGQIRWLFDTASQKLKLVEYVFSRYL